MLYDPIFSFNTAPPALLAFVYSIPLTRFDIIMSQRERDKKEKEKEPKRKRNKQRKRMCIRTAKYKIQIDKYKIKYFPINTRVFLYYISQSSMLNWHSKTTKAHPIRMSSGCRY